MARRAAFVRQFCAEHPNTLVLDCGDISQGTPYYNFYKGEVEIQLMNHMGYDAMTIGNHEFDFGMENMARLFRMARFPVVCSNYDVTGTPPFRPGSPTRGTDTGRQVSGRGLQRPHPRGAGDGRPPS